MVEYKKILNQNILKLIAIFAMTLDHITWLVFPNYSTEPLAIIFHIIGRLACPIMCYCIAEGYYYTRNLNKYIARLFLFAIISHVPYMLQTEIYRQYGPLCFIPFATGNGINRFLNQGGVIWSFAIGLLMLKVNDNEKLKWPIKFILIILLCFLSFPVDWSCIASLCVLAIGSNRGKPINQIIWCFIWITLYVVVYYFSLSKTYAFLQYCTFLSIPVIMLYNGKRGNNPKINKIMKWLFYIYYPLHLLVIGLILNVFLK